MPLYEYRCLACAAPVSIRMTYAEFDTAKPKCPQCKSTKLQRHLSRVRVLRSEDSRMEQLSDPSNFNDIDENDPKSVGRFMRRMGEEMGEDMGGEFNEMAGRLEAGEDPQSIERELGLGAAGDGGSGMGDFDD